MKCDRNPVSLTTHLLYKLSQNSDIQHKIKIVIQFKNNYCHCGLFLFEESIRYWCVPNR